MPFKNKAYYRRYQKTWRAKNKVRLTRYLRKWHADNKERRRPLQRAAHIMRTYGLTTEAHEKLLAKQNKGCAVCGDKTPEGYKNQWHVDHDHKTNSIRGLLCFACNVGLGCFKDNIARLKKAAQYLRKHELKEPV